MARWAADVPVRRAVAKVPSALLLLLLLLLPPATKANGHGITDWRGASGWWGMGNQGSCHPLFMFF